jgi:mevalonate pyrophosphate decarboxylase
MLGYTMQALGVAGQDNATDDSAAKNDRGLRRSAAAAAATAAACQDEDADGKKDQKDLPASHPAQRAATR